MGVVSLPDKRVKYGLPPILWIGGRPSQGLSDTSEQRRKCPEDFGKPLRLGLTTVTIHATTSHGTAVAVNELGAIHSSCEHTKGPARSRAGPWWLIGNKNLRITRLPVIGGWTDYAYL